MAITVPASAEITAIINAEIALYQSYIDKYRQGVDTIKGWLAPCIVSEVSSDHIHILSHTMTVIDCVLNNYVFLIHDLRKFLQRTTSFMITEIIQIRNHKNDNATLIQHLYTLINIVLVYRNDINAELDEFKRQFMTATRIKATAESDEEDDSESDEEDDSDEESESTDIPADTHADNCA